MHMAENNSLWNNKSFWKNTFPTEGLIWYNSTGDSCARVVILPRGDIQNSVESKEEALSGRILLFTYSDHILLHIYLYTLN